MAKEENKTEGFFTDFKKLVSKHFGSQKFAEAKLKDGTVIYYEGEMPMEGMEVWVIPSDGTEKLPAPDGVHSLEDGTQLEVVGGKIVKVAAPAPMNTDKPADVPATEAAAKRIVESTIKETVFTKAEVDEKIAALSAQFDAKFTSLKTETDQSVTALKSENETLTKQVADAKAEAAKFKAQMSGFMADLEKFGAQPPVAETAKPAEIPNGKVKPPSMEEFKSKYIKQ